MLRDSKGATAIEYGLLAAFVALAAMTASRSLGARLSQSIDEASAQLSIDADPDASNPGASDPGPSNQLASNRIAIGSASSANVVGARKDPIDETKWSRDCRHRNDCGIWVR